MKIKNILLFFLFTISLQIYAMKVESRKSKKQNKMIHTKLSNKNTNEKEKKTNKKPKKNEFFNMHALECLENLFKNEPINMDTINKIITKLNDYFKKEKDRTIQLNLNHAINSYETLKLASKKKEIKECHDNVVYRLQRLALLNNTAFNLLMNRNKTQVSKLL